MVDTHTNPFITVWNSLSKEQQQEISVKAYGRGLFAVWPTLGLLFFLYKGCFIIFPLYVLALIWNFLRRRIAVTMELYPEQLSKKDLEDFLGEDEPLPVPDLSRSRLDEDFLYNPGLSGHAGNIYNHRNR